MPIEIGVLFTTWEDLRAEVENWSIEEHFQFKLTHEDQTRADYRCKHLNSGCSWHVYASLEQQGNIKVKKVEQEHQCAGAHQTNRQVSNTQSWLQRVVPLYLFVTKSTEP